MCVWMCLEIWMRIYHFHWRPFPKAKVLWNVLRDLNAYLPFPWRPVPKAIVWWIIVLRDLNTYCSYCYRSDDPYKKSMCGWMCLEIWMRSRTYYFHWRPKSIVLWNVLRDFLKCVITISMTLTKSHCVWWIIVLRDLNTYLLLPFRRPILKANHVWLNVLRDLNAYFIISTHDYQKPMCGGLLGLEMWILIYYYHSDDPY